MVRTHRHILRVLENHADAWSASSLIVDAGCGDGRLLRALQDRVACRVAGFDSDLYGDFANQRQDGEVERLDIRRTNEDGSWPFEDCSADIVVSNQVIEHVADLDAFCREAGRVSKPGAIGIHVFPLRTVVIEPHLDLPFVHRIRDHDLRVAAIRSLARAGIGKYDAKGAHRSMPVDTYADMHADYLRTHTAYRSWREIAETFERHGFRVTRRYTSMFLRGVLAANSKPLAAPFEAMLFPIASRVSSITLTTEYVDTYRWSSSADH